MITHTAMKRIRLSWPLGVLLVALGAQPATAQWIDYPEKNVPRKSDGTVDLEAPTPRGADGKPQLSGLWLVPDIQQYGWNLGKDLEGGLPLQPWARKLVEQRNARGLIDDPSSRCHPTGLIGLMLISPFRINVLRDRIIILFEQNTTYRQLFLDGRPLPPQARLPSYMGYSVARWEGDTLVVESTGFNGKSWIDADGHPITEQLHLTERYRRPSFGRLEIELTFDDPLAYTKPWTVRVPFKYVPNSELTESFCEDNKFEDQLKDAGMQPLEIVPQAPPPEGDAAEPAAPASETASQGSAQAPPHAAAPTKTLSEELAGLPTKMTGRGRVLTLGDVLFEVGQDALRPGANQTLDRIAQALKRVPQRRVTINGYTDDVGGDDYNRALSHRRAEAVRTALIQRGVSSWQTTAVGQGKRFPVASNGSAAGRQQNRRVELMFND